MECFKFKYSQSSGKFFDEEDNLICVCYAGNNSRPGVNPTHIQGMNNPKAQHLHCIGPLPQGSYTIEKPIHHPVLGVLAMPLTPDPSNEMYGRDGFYIHGGSGDPAHNESEGCIIMQRHYREFDVGLRTPAILTVEE